MLFPRGEEIVPARCPLCREANSPHHLQQHVERGELLGEETSEEEVVLLGVL